MRPVIKETNDKLIADRNEPLYAVYPETAYRSATRHFGFVDRGRGQGGRDLLSPTCRLPAQERNPGADRSDRTAGSSWARRLAQGRRDHHLDPSRPLTVVRPAGARRHSKGAGALSGSAPPTVIDRAVSRCVRQHAGPWRTAIARGDAIPADPRAHPRDAGCNVEGRPDHRAAIQRSCALDRDGQWRRDRARRPASPRRCSCARMAAPISTPAARGRWPP